MSIELVYPAVNRLNRELVIVDMFCGAGGTGQGIKEALEEMGLKARMFAINHWDVAVNL